MPHVSIREDRVLVVDGKPFFPLGARHVPVGADLSVLADAGFNSFRHLAVGGHNMEPTVLPRDLHGLLFWAYVYNLTDLEMDPDHRERLTELVKGFRAHPALLSYENMNECAWTFRRPGVARHTPEALEGGYRLLKSLDPNHPVKIAHATAGTVETLEAYNTSNDIVGCNPYPVYPAGIRQHVGVREDGRILDCPNQTISAVGDYTGKMMAVARGRPVWMLIQAMAWENFFSPLHTPEFVKAGKDSRMVLYPTCRQMRFMAIHAIIRGATGLSFSMFGTPVGEPVWQDIKRVVGELRRLEGVLCSPVAAMGLNKTYEDLGATVWTGVETLVKMADDGLWILSANTQFDPMTVSFGGLPESISEVSEVPATPGDTAGEGSGTIAVAGGGFRAHYEPYEVKVFFMRNFSASDEPKGA